MIDSLIDSLIYSFCLINLFIKQALIVKHSIVNKPFCKILPQKIFHVLSGRRCEKLKHLTIYSTSTPRNENCGSTYILTGSEKLGYICTDEWLYKQNKTGQGMRKQSQKVNLTSMLD